MMKVAHFPGAAMAKSNSLLGGLTLGLIGAFCNFPPETAQSGEQALPKLNGSKPPGPAPAGMVWVPGGEFYMGIAKEQIKKLPNAFHFRDCQPVHKVYVDGFWMDRTEVTNEQFAQFVKATNYVTRAERKPDPR